MWPPLAEVRGGRLATGQVMKHGAMDRKTNNTRLTTLPKTKNKIEDLRQIDRKSPIECFLLKTKENMT